MENKHIKMSDSVEFKIIDDETIILEPESSNFFRLNDTGTEVWKLADGKMSIGEIARKITEMFEISKEEALKDVVSIVKELEKNKLIKFC